MATRMGIRMAWSELVAVMMKQEWRPKRSVFFFVGDREN